MYGAGGMILIRIPPLNIIAVYAAVAVSHFAVGCVAIAAAAMHMAWRAIEYGVGREPRRWSDAQKT